MEKKFHFAPSQKGCNGKRSRGEQQFSAQLVKQSDAEISRSQEAAVPCGMRLRGDAEPYVQNWAETSLLFA